MKNGRRPRSFAYIVPVIILTGMLIFAGIQALIIYIPQSKDSRNFEKLKEDVKMESITAEEILSGNESASSGDPEYGDADGGVSDAIRSLAEQNRDFVGWLSIEDTIIDYPVMKSSERDPEYYLHRDFDKNYSDSGTLFIGEGCNADSEVFIIYGHNMNAGTMFGSLDSYMDTFFAYDHKDIVFRTLSGDRVYRVFAAFQAKIYPEGTDAFEYYRSVGNLNVDEYNYALNSIRDMSLISFSEAPVYPEQIMLLSTCYYHTDQGRFVVAAFRIK